MGSNRIAETAAKIKAEIAKVLVDKETVTEYIIAAYFAGGHILLEDLPGTGKTMLARTLATAVAGTFKRIQFTPDLLPTNVTGLNYFNQEKQRFVFREGPVFANVILADEINRATPRTQSSLLESMEEGQVSIDGVTRKLPEPFFVIATQNPVEALGTFPLPEAQMDRFMMKLQVGFPNFNKELDMIDRFMLENPAAHVQPVCTPEEICEIREEVKQIHFHGEVRQYLLKIVRSTREDGRFIAGASPRCTLSFVRAVQALAAIRGRAFVIPEDVRELAPYIISHRVIRADEYEARSSLDDIRILADKVEPPVEPVESFR